MTELLHDKSYYGKSKIAQWGVADDQMTNTQKWLCFIALFLFATFSLYQNMMLAPCLTDVAAAFNIEPSNMGWIMSVFTITGLILAYPGTWVMQTFGIKFSIMASGVFELVGNFVCLSAGDATMFLVGRAIQGCGLGLICVIGPNIMPRLMPTEKMGLTMGIWSQWVVPGIAIASLSTAAIFSAGGWQALFYTSTIFTTVSIILVLVFVKMPLIPENIVYGAKHADEESVSAEKRKTFPRSAFVVGFAFIAWCFMYGSFSSYYPTYAQTVGGMDMFSASMTTFLVTLVTAPCGIFAGWLADRLRMRKLFLLIGLAAATVYCALFMWTLDTPMAIYAGCVFLGAICCAIVPTMTRAIIPVLAVDLKITDWALTGMAVVTSLANLLNGFVPTLSVNYGYGVTGIVLAAFLAIAFVCMLFIKNDRDLA